MELNFFKFKEIHDNSKILSQYTVYNTVYAVTDFQVIISTKILKATKHFQKLIFTKITFKFTRFQKYICIIHILASQSFSFVNYYV